MTAGFIQYSISSVCCLVSLMTSFVEINNEIKKDFCKNEAIKAVMK